MKKYSGMLANGNAKYKVKKSKQLPIVIKYLLTHFTYIHAKKKVVMGKKWNVKTGGDPFNFGPLHELFIISK